MSLETYFNEREEGERRIGTALTDIALDKKLEQFVRETAQNSADETVSSGNPELCYRFDRLEDDRLDDFLEAINWDSNFKGHLKAVAEDDDEIGVQSMLDRVDDGDGQLPLLMVEDRNTTGLTGGEFSDGTNYVSLVEDFGRSTKEESEGGVHGVGASVLWGFSGFKTTMFLTTPNGWSDSRVPRLVGRIDLPFHEWDGQDWHGDGWIGGSDPQNRRAVSLEGDEAEDVGAEDLHIDDSRTRADATGTTAVVVGFREPSRSRRSPGKVIKRIEELAIRYYWPLILEEGIDISVEAPGDPASRTADPRNASQLDAFIEAYEKRDEADDSLESAPDVAAIDVPITIPPREGEGQATEAEIKIVVRSFENRPENIPNKMALFRGARHVVRYRPYDHVARSTGQHFQAILLAGRAKYPLGVDEQDVDDEDLLVEDFFRSAEPKAHDTWEKGVSKLEQKYPGGRDSINELFGDTIPTRLSKLLTQAGAGEGEMLGDVGRKFPYFSGGPNRGRDRAHGGGGSRTIDHVDPKLSHINDLYHASGTLELVKEFDNDWGLTLEFAVLDSSNNEIETVELDSISGVDPSTGSKYQTMRGGTMVRVPADKETVEFVAESVSTADIDAVGEGRTRLNFTIESNVTGSNP